MKNEPQLTPQQQYERIIHGYVVAILHKINKQAAQTVRELKKEAK